LEEALEVPLEVPLETGGGEVALDVPFEVPFEVPLETGGGEVVELPAEPLLLEEELLPEEFPNVAFNSWRRRPPLLEDPLLTFIAVSLPETTEELEPTACIGMTSEDSLTMAHSMIRGLVKSLWYLS
jgi:hypothetical protein